MRIALYIRKSTLLLGALMMLMSLAAPLLSNNEALAANTKYFNPERIIDDSVFTNNKSMSVSSIQSWLESSSINSTCLKQYRAASVIDHNGNGWIEDLTRTGTDSNGKPTYKLGPEAYGTSYYGDTSTERTMSAAEIIKSASDIYRINPRVMLATLEKEQGLVRRSDCPTWRYNSAMGYGCPDNAPCDTSKVGFSRQIDYGAYHFRGYYDDSLDSVPYGVGSAYVLYNPDTSCGGKTLNIRNRATASLYSYTPYQPNSKALAAAPGQEVTCGAYGNLNFWRYFTDWFGTTYSITFSSMVSPRWMQTKADVYKRSPDTGTQIDSVIPAGTQIYFPNKTTINGVTYLRTQYDSDRSNLKGILLSDLEEVPMDYSPMKQPRWMETTRDLYKINPQTKERVHSSVPAGSQIYFPTKVTVGGEMYLRTQYDTSKDIQAGIPVSDLRDTAVEYTDFIKPRWMQADNDTGLLNLKELRNVLESIPAGTHRYFDKKVTINGTSYAHKGMPAAGSFAGVPLNSLDEIPLDFVQMQRPRWMLTNSDVYKRYPNTETRDGSAFPQSTELLFESKITIGGVTYLRTKYDTIHNIPRGFKLPDLQEVPQGFQPLEFVPMKYPRVMSLNVDGYKVYPSTGGTVGESIPKGTELYFTTKVDVDGVTYLRTQTDSNKGYSLAVPLDKLQ